MTTRYEPAIDVEALRAIDAHVHIEIDAHGHSSLPDDLAEAASKYFRTDGPRPDPHQLRRKQPSDRDLTARPAPPGGRSCCRCGNLSLCEG